MEVLDLVAASSWGVVVGGLSNEVFTWSPSEPIYYRLGWGADVIFVWKDNSHRSDIDTHTHTHTHTQHIQSQNDEQIPMIYGEQVISEVRKIKFRGVMLDNKVNWKDHINYISGKVSRGIGMILKARRYLTKKALMTL